MSREAVVSASVGNKGTSGLGPSGVAAGTTENGGGVDDAVEVAWFAFGVQFRDFIIAGLGKMAEA